MLNGPGYLILSRRLGSSVGEDFGIGELEVGV